MNPFIIANNLFILNKHSNFPKIKKSTFYSLSMITLITVFFSCNNNAPATENKDAMTTTPKIKEEAASYTCDNVTMNGFVA